MSQLIPYLIIPNRCQQALHFYRECFSGEIVLMQKYDDTDYQVSADFQDKIAHAEFKSNEVHLYLSDGFEGQPVTIGSNVAISIDFDDQANQRRVFEKLKEGGTVTMGFSETSVDSSLATLIDQYGIHWHLNFSKKGE